MGPEAGPSSHRSAAGPKRFGPWLMGQANGPKFNGSSRLTHEGWVERRDPNLKGPAPDPQRNDPAAGPMGSGSF